MILPVSRHQRVGLTELDIWAPKFGFYNAPLTIGLSEMEKVVRGSGIEFETQTDIYIYICVYIYMCVCVCVCMCVLLIIIKV